MKSEASCDVYLSFASRDADLAAIVRRGLEAKHLSVFTGSNSVIEGGEWEDRVRSAMADARVFLLLLTRSTFDSQLVLLELGAALGLGTSVKVLTQGLTPSELPPVVRNFEVVTFSDLDNLVDRIAASTRPLREDQVEALRKIYLGAGVTSDELAANPAELNRFTERFNLAVDSQFPPMRVIQELFRLRKRGRLPRLRGVTRS